LCFLALCSRMEFRVFSVGSAFLSIFLLALIHGWLRL
jgi:hypothetical protein